MTGDVDVRRIRNSSFLTWVGLVLGSWVGLLWGSLLFMPVGAGFGIAAASAMGGYIAVPLWGTFWGLTGLSGQRNKALRDLGIKVLPDDDPLTQRVGALAARLGLTTRPWVAIMPHNNAFAIGATRNSAMVVLGQPLINTLTDAELDAIIGHELGHIATNDMRRMGLARSFQNALVWYFGFSRTLQRWVRWILTWMSEFLILAMSRRREYWADAVGAALTSKEDMISALEKLHHKPRLSSYERHHARLMIHGVDSSVFSTHPNFLQRKRALEKEKYLRFVKKPVVAEEVLAAPVTLPLVAEMAYVNSK
ncbi:M48 family metalloprotease [Agrobacterium bohemicum]|uniref:Protease n=1 Tax=Agrobacterium bohemicum TaxID=2052828 RepID=A0A135P847_9HYPH|nr:M48 family metalloprotease [Agrobacterium bohemicum]KXG87605.1 protease [Agrobacterium bohemicum]